MDTNNYDHGNTAAAPIDDEIEGAADEERQINLLRPDYDALSLRPTRGRPRGRIWAFFIIILTIAALTSGWLIIRQNTLARLPADPRVYDPATLKPKNIGLLASVKNFIFHSNNFLEGQQDDRVNILLLGVGGPGHDGPFLSDTSIIISIKPSAKQVAFRAIWA